MRGSTDCAGMGDERDDDAAQRRTRTDDCSSARIGTAAAFTLVLVVLLVLDVAVPGYDVSPGGADGADPGLHGRTLLRLRVVGTAVANQHCVRTNPSLGTRKSWSRPVRRRSGGRVGSGRLRNGDDEAAAVASRHGRIRSRMMDELVRGWLVPPDLLVKAEEDTADRLGDPPRTPARRRSILAAIVVRHGRQRSCGSWGNEASRFGGASLPGRAGSRGRGARAARQGCFGAPGGCWARASYPYEIPIEGRDEWLAAARRLA